MKLASVEMIEIRLPLVHFFETSFGRTTERRIVLIRVSDIDGGEGWGECTAGEGPFYSSEWTDAAWLTIKTYLAPMILGREIERVEDVFNLMKPVRGHHMAKAALETACWDLASKRAGIALWRYLGGTQKEIACGVSIGIQDSIESLLDKIDLELAAGYQRIKIKIKPGWDVKVVDRVRAHYPSVRLMVDANSAYHITDAKHLKLLDEFELMMIEQPLADDDIFDHATLQRELNTAICLDESIRTPDDAGHAIDVKACRVINLKLGRIGGHSQAKLAEQVCRERDIPVWCGGMLESGIGRAHNIAMSTLAGFKLPGDVSASKRYWKEDIIEPDVRVSQNGTITASEEPGIGYLVNRELIDALAAKQEVIPASSV